MLETDLLVHVLLDVAQSILKSSFEVGNGNRRSAGTSILAELIQYLDKPLVYILILFISYPKGNIKSRNVFYQWVGHISGSATFTLPSYYYSHLRATTLGNDYNYIGNSCISSFCTLLTGASIMTRLAACTATPNLRPAPPYTTTILLRFLDHLPTYGRLA